MLCKTPSKGHQYGRGLNSRRLHYNSEKAKTPSVTTEGVFAYTNKKCGAA